MRLEVVAAVDNGPAVRALWRGAVVMRRRTEILYRPMVGV
jgi:hypothetical protein